jgi:uncharacterized 2Fe-2S/4Fe-4S cluster protein (DUF4445 family)
MPNEFTVHLLPLGKTLEVKAGVSLQDVLFDYGVEFPCGGESRCGGCRVRVLEGSVPPTREHLEYFSPEEIAAGWRLSCLIRVESPLKLEIAQWESPILSDDTSFQAEPAEGFGVAVDLGTTTLVVQLLNLFNGQVLNVQTALNPQAVHGADLMSRIQFAMTEGGSPVGRQTLEIRACLGALIGQALSQTGVSPCDLKEVVLAGNTVMHHLFCGIDVEPLSHVPFEAVRDGMEILTADQLDWHQCGDPIIRFLPCLGGFVGSDILAGVLATGIAESDTLVALTDLGTNGEIVVGNREGMLCASTAAGPAFEAGRIRMGMRASAGAITEVWARDGELRCHVLGNVSPRGICGSGVVDAVAAGLDLKLIQPNGRLGNGWKELPLLPPVSLTQNDIRELQLAKGAIAAGLQILLEKAGAGFDTLQKLHLAGAFGNYVNRRSAHRIGLLELDPLRVHPAGNTSLQGAKMVLLSKTVLKHAIERIRPKIRHVSLGSDPRFQELFVEKMNFPPESS